MRLRTIIIIYCLTFSSCNKKNDDQITKTFSGNLPIVHTNTPATAILGQDIRSIVRCELSSLSGSVYFQGFDVRETSPKQYAISAKALYKNWNTQIGLPVMWTLDTVATVKTTTAGMYVLKFYNALQLLKSDSVQVN